MRGFPKWSALLSILFVAAPTFAQQLANPDFDSDLAGWTQNASTGIVIDWFDAGSPSSGTARYVSATPPVSNIGGSLSQCFNGVTPGDDWKLSARVQTDLRSGDRCYLGVYFYSQPNCGSASFGSTPTSLYVVNPWTTLVEHETAPGGSVSAQVVVGISTPAPTLADSGALAGTASTCRIDTVRLAVNGIYAQEFELLPADWSSLQPASCADLCFLKGSPDGGECFCDEYCVVYDDCCIDACSTCGQCP